MLFNQSIGQEIAVSGFLRCSFNKAGFDRRENARIFEIHPVRTVAIDGELHSFELSTPASSVTDWAAGMGDLDERCKVRYWKGTDTLVSSPVNVEREEFVQVAGEVRDITLNISTKRPAWFMLNNAEIGRQLKVVCLQGTNAVRQLRDLRAQTASVIGLRSVDLSKALEDRYRITMLGFDIQAG